MSYAKAVPATDGAKGFDINSNITDKVHLLANDFDFCVRYVSHGSHQGSNDLTTNEVRAILDSGLALMIVQHVSRAGWTPTPSLGTTFGERAAAYTDALQLVPKNTTVWMDLEGVNANHSKSDVIAYCNNWYDKVHAAGYTPGIYIGSRAYLSSQDLYAHLKFQHYWKSMSTVPTPEHRGFQMYQQRNPATNHQGDAHIGEYQVHGIWVDRDYIQHDNGTAGTQVPIWAIKND